MSNRSSPIHIDFVTVMLVFGIVLLGLVMVTSASISMATKEGGDAFGYLLRQFTLVIAGSVFAALMFTIRTEWLEKMAVAGSGSCFAGARADPGHWPLCQRRPSLDPAGWHQHTSE
jgi:cell division protein FtsW (lipid II flippase)